MKNLFFWLLALSATSPTLADDPIECGRYIVEVIGACGNCHTPVGPEGPDTSKHLAGGMTFEFPGMAITVPNITPDKETGIGAWSDAEIIRAFREGVRPDGRVLGPLMPIALYREISDGDAAAIVAYLRTVPPVNNATEVSRYDFPLPDNWGPPLGVVPEPDRDDPVAYGEYLAGPLGHCVECHSPPGENGLPDHHNQLAAGGLTFPGPWGTSVSPNLTPTGLAQRSDDDIRQMITTGTRPDGSPMLPPMPFYAYANLVPEDLDAIIAYLRSLPPK
ncbi:cytochrome c [Marinihelvus fidelis]|uniref:Cytochrome c n=1 Tax=Marinihelvus fidelis TaxID=2613842 RepID=A0A5N0THI6_9GAMM|nr:c-type cytochrome [Marinihelvus fidelis]KAA9132769.1 cytochrome c [Marinihelvus fidelis]